MDEKFLKKCISGNSKAQKAFYDMYAPKMYSICYRYAVDNYMAEEMMQEGFIKIFQNLPKFKWKGSFDGWVHRIMVNTSLEYLRKNKRNHQQLSIDKSSISHNIDTNAIDELSAQEIMESIRQLPEGYREVVNLYIVDGYSHKEISKLLSISEDNSKQRLSRARTLLQKKLTLLYRTPNETVPEQ